MAFPVVKARGSGGTTSTGGGHTIPLPAGIVAGDMLLVLMRNRGVGNSISSMSGWTMIRNSGWTAIAWRKAAGVETDFYCLWNGGSRVSYLTWVFDGTTTTDWDVERPPELTATSWSETWQDPLTPQHETSWALADNLFIRAATWNTGSTGLTYPAVSNTRAYPTSDSPDYYPAAAGEWQSSRTLSGTGTFDVAGTNPTVGTAANIAISPKELAFENPPADPDPTFEGNVHVHDGSVWQPISNLHINDGSWGTAQRVWISDGVGWVLAWENEITETFPFSDGMTFVGEEVDAAGFRSRTPATTEPNIISVSSGPGYYYSESGGWYRRGMWVPGTGSVTGNTISAALLNRTLLEFKISIGLDSGGWYSYWGDGYPANMAIWGSSYASVPSDLNPSELVFLGVISWYPNAEAYDSGWAVVTENMLNISPQQDGDRAPVFYQDIDLFPQLDANAKTKLTNGFVKSFVVQPYYYDRYGSLRQTYWHPYWMTSSLFPGEYYDGTYWWGSRVPSTGNADAFRIKATHTGQV